MKKILIFILLMVPALAQAGTLDLGFKEIRSAELERAYHLGLEHDMGEFSVGARRNYGRIGEVVNINDARISLGYDPVFSDKWSGWFDATAGYNKPGGIEAENFLGAGPKYTAYRSDSVKASISFGYIHHWQSMFGSDGVPEYKTVKRWSLRAKYKRTGEHGKALLVASYQPAVDDSADYLSTAEASYSIVLNDFMDLKLSVSDEYRSIVPEGRENNKLTETVMIVLKF
jgi:hypothetical protein